MKEKKIEEMTIEGENFLFILDSKHKNDFFMHFHYHDFYELSFVLQGTGRYEKLENSVISNYELQENNILLWDGRVAHRAMDSPDQPLEQLIIIFDQAYLNNLKDHKLIEESLKQQNPMYINQSHHVNAVKSAFRDILKEVRAKERGSESLIFSSFSRILIQLLRSDEGLSAVYSEDDRINRSLEYIHHNYHTNLSIAHVANISGLSLRQFTLLFKKEMGVTFTQYLNLIRIEKAREALRSTNISITELAFQCGFDDLSYFNKRFKAVEQMSPRAYRKLYNPAT